MAGMGFGAGTGIGVGGSGSSACGASGMGGGLIGIGGGGEGPGLEAGFGSGIGGSGLGKVGSSSGQLSGSFSVSVPLSGSLAKPASLSGAVSSSMGLSQGSLSGGLGAGSLEPSRDGGGSWRVASSSEWRGFDLPVPSPAVSSRQSSRLGFDICEEGASGDGAMIGGGVSGAGGGAGMGGMGMRMGIGVEGGECGRCSRACACAVEKERERECAICLEEQRTKVALPLCGHCMCRACFKDWYALRPCFLLFSLLCTLCALCTLLAFSVGNAQPLSSALSVLFFLRDLGNCTRPRCDTVQSTHWHYLLFFVDCMP